MKSLWSVKGMTCGHCARAVKEALMQHPDVINVEADYQKAEAEIQTTGEPPVRQLNEMLAARGDYFLVELISSER
jgi:copper chaperone CopZ